MFEKFCFKFVKCCCFDERNVHSLHISSSQDLVDDAQKPLFPAANLLSQLEYFALNRTREGLTDILKVGKASISPLSF